MVELRFHSSVRVALAALSVLSAVTVADAATAPAKPKLTETITCRDFVQMREEFKPTVVSYALGYTHAKQPQLDAVYVGGVARLVPVLVQSCRARPTETLLQRISAFFHRL